MPVIHESDRCNPRPPPPALPRRMRHVDRYDFDVYSEASDKMYRIFLHFAPVVMAVSCDEAFLELAKGTDPMTAATEVLGEEGSHRSFVDMLLDVTSRTYRCRM